MKTVIEACNQHGWFTFKNSGLTNKNGLATCKNIKSTCFTIKKRVEYDWSIQKWSSTSLSIKNGELFLMEEKATSWYTNCLSSRTIGNPRVQDASHASRLYPCSFPMTWGQTKFMSALLRSNAAEDHHLDPFCYTMPEQGPLFMSMLY